MGTNRFEGLPKKALMDVIGTLKPCDLFFCAGNYPISKMIEQFSQSAFSHVGFLFGWDARMMLFESVEDDGVRSILFNKYLTDYENSGQPYDGRMFIARYEQSMIASQTPGILESATYLLGRKYNTDEIAQILARVTLGVGDHHANNTYICSEFVDACFSENGITLLRDPKTGFIFPEHIAADPNVTPLYELVP